jgi:hypothetical protein
MLNEAGLTRNTYLEFKPSASVAFVAARLVLAAIVLILLVQSQCDLRFLGADFCCCPLAANPK